MCGIAGALGGETAEGPLSPVAEVDGTAMGTPSGRGTKVVLLGTAGGPVPLRQRSGIAQAVVVRGACYLVDCGNGVARQLMRSGCGLVNLRQVFITHLHSDHDSDYFNLFLLGWKPIQRGARERDAPVDVWGPGPAGGLSSLPPYQPGADAYPVVSPGDPTPGLVAMTSAQLHAHAYDINLRMRGSGHCDLTTLFVPHEIRLPPNLHAAGPEHVAPPMEPIFVYEDERVRVTAILVDHRPVFPSFAYRFDTEDGSIIVSGDTCPSPNLIRLARGGDILVHEVYDAAAGRRFAQDVPGALDHVDVGAMTRHIVTSHTSLDDVGRVATESGVGRLVLSHFIPGQETDDGIWRDGAKANFDGEVLVGRDLMEVSL